MEYVLDLGLSFWAPGTAATLILWLLYYYLVLPMDWSKDLSDVGFDCSDNKSKSKMAMVREAQRKRRVGVNLPPVYPNGWFSVLESCTLAKGQVRHVFALGQNLAVFRGMSGKAHVLDAYCPHVGANMAIGGKVHGDCLECPFHAWEFSGKNGQCTSIPYSEKVPDFAKVRCWETRETNGFVFVWHHAEGEPPSWAPQPVPHVNDGSWTFVGRNEFFINCHIQEIHENGADKAHLTVVHGPGLLLPGLSEHAWDQHWEANTADGYQHTATMHLKHQYKLFGKFSLLKMDVRAEQTGPGYVELYVDTQLGPVVILQTVTPVEPLLQKVVHRMYSPTLILPYAKFLLYGESVMFERDIMVWNHKKFEDKPILIKEDKPVTRYRRWYSQFYTEHSPKHVFQRETLDW